MTEVPSNVQVVKEIDNDSNKVDSLQSIVSPIYDIFEKHMEDISTDRLQYIEYYDTTVNFNAANDINDYRIQVNEKDHWFLLNKSYIQVDFQLMQPDNTAWAGGQNVALQNNAAGMFSRWELKFDDSIVEYEDDADICNTIQSLVYFDSNYSNSIARNLMWYPDTIDSINIDSTITPVIANHQLQFSHDAGATWTDVTDAQFQVHTDTGVNFLTFNGVGADTDLVRVKPHVVTGNSLPTASETINYGQRKRQQLLNNSTRVTVQIPLKNVLGLTKAMTHVTKGIKYELRLSRNLDNRIIYAANPSISKIWRVSWFIPRVSPNVSVLKLLENKLRQPGLNFYLPYIDTQIFRTNLITAAASNQIYQIRVKRKNPIKIFVAFALDDPANVNGLGPIARVSGDQSNGKRVFDNIQLTMLRCVLNSTTQFPEREYQTSFINNAFTGYKYSREYNELMRAALKDHDIDQGSIITYDNFRSIFPIFAIDLEEKEDYIIKPDSALIEIYWSNSTILNYYMYVLVESESKVHFTSNNGSMKFVEL